MSDSSSDNVILWTKEDNDYVNSRNYFSGAHFPFPKNFLENKIKKSGEALKKKRWVGKEILNSINKNPFANQTGFQIASRPEVGISVVGLFRLFSHGSEFVTQSSLPAELTLPHVLDDIMVRGQALLPKVHQLQMCVCLLASLGGRSS